MASAYHVCTCRNPSLCFCLYIFCRVRDLFLPPFSSFLLSRSARFYVTTSHVHSLENFTDRLPCSQSVLIGFQSTAHSKLIEFIRSLDTRAVVLLLAKSRQLPDRPSFPIF